MKKEKKEDSSEEKDTEKITEIFEVEKKGDGIKKEIIKKDVKVEEKEEKPSKKEVKKENKILRIVIFVILGFILAFFIIYLSSYYTTHFEIDGVQFEIVKTGQLIVYRTSLPGIIDKDGNFSPGIYDKGDKAEYNIYFRNDPRKLSDVEFHEVVSQVKKENVLNIEGDFDCDGDGVIAVANLVQMYKILGGNIIKDENATCDKEGRYGMINIQKGNTTEIERVGPACFNIYINDCEILKGTEKYMLEALIKINERLEK